MSDAPTHEEMLMALRKVIADRAQYARDDVAVVALAQLVTAYATVAALPNQEHR